MAFRESLMISNRLPRFPI